MDADIQQKLKELWMAYSKELPVKAHELEKLWTKYKLNPDPETFDVLHRSAHTLSGTAGTYGYTLVGNLARKLDILFTKNKGTALAGSVIEEVDNLLQDLDQLVLGAPLKRVDPAFDIPFEIQNKTRIIYILDNKNVDLKKQSGVLEQFNYDVSLFHTAQNLIDAVASKLPDILIMDVDCASRIPDEVINQLRHESIMVIYMSERDEFATRLFGVRHKGQMFFVKPFEINAMLRTFDDLFEAKQVQNEKVLIVDDSEFLAQYYAMVLEKTGLKTKVVNEPKQFLIVLQEFQPDLILMDVNMPFCNGSELARIVHQQPNFSGVPIIFLSSIVEKNKQLEILGSAADEFLTKPIDPKELLVSVHNRLIRSRIIRARMMRDGLTNLYNHTMIHHQLDREILIAERHHTPVTVALLDIDHFKSINDTYGHQGGDKILIDLSNFLQANLRRTDLLGRYGGEEFLIILPNTNEEDAIQILNQLREKFANTTHTLGEKEVFVKISIGVANYPTLTDKTELVRAADEALYKAKNRGRNQVIAWKELQ